MSAASRYRANRIVAVATEWARAMDPVRDPLDGRWRIGWVAKMWASVKLGVVALMTPVWAPAIIARAAANHRRAQRLAAEFPEQVRAIAAGRAPDEPNNKVVDLPASVRMVVFSDLHRCVHGRVDWPARQRTKRLYELILDAYDADEWTVCENGDIEDYWMVGGSTYGAAYDALRIAGGALAGLGHTALLTETYRAHLDEIVSNNEGIYQSLRDRFVRRGRYVRTVGNHDGPTSRPMLADRLHQHLGAFPLGDYVALRDPDGTLVALITHGHHTDAWNAPQRDNLGKLSSWIANTLLDVPLLDSPEGLPSPDSQQRMLDGRLPDRLIEVHPTFGANSDYDSLDEELLWDAVRTAGLEDVWMILGHTHFALSSPLSRSGDRWERYLNSGSGVSDGLVTAIEWDGSGDEPSARLVAWTIADDATPTSAIVVTPDGHRLARYELEPDGDTLRPTSAMATA